MVQSDQEPLQGPVPGDSPEEDDHGHGNSIIHKIVHKWLNCMVIAVHKGPLCCALLVFGICFGVIAAGLSMHSPSVQTEFSSFTKATTNASLTRDAFMAALIERESGSRAMRRLAEEHPDLVKEVEELGLTFHEDFDSQTDEDDEADYNEEIETQVGGSGFGNQTRHRRLADTTTSTTTKCVSACDVAENLEMRTNYKFVKKGDPQYDPAKGFPLFRSYDFMIAWEPTMEGEFDKPGAIFTEKALRYMQRFEMEIRQEPKWKALCEKTIPGSRGLCEPGISFVNYALPSLTNDPATGLPVAIKFDGLGESVMPLQVIFTLLNQVGVSMILTPKTFRESQPELTTMLRVGFRFKFLCCWSSMARDDKTAAREVLDDEWLEFASNFILPYFEAKEEAAREKDGGEPFRVFFVGNDLAMLQVWKALFADARFAAGSAFVVFAYLTIHTQSIYLSILGLLMMVLSIPLAFAVFAMMADSGKLSIASFLSLFVIVGIGADDVFVFTDFWRFSKDECKTEEERIRFTFHHAGKATIATSVTTALAFFANLASVLGPLREFGTFMGLCVCWLWILVTSLYVPLLILETRYCLCCRLNFDVVSCMQKIFAKFKGQNHESQNRLLMWSNFVNRRRRTLLMGSGAAVVVFLVGTASFLNINMSVPNIFPDSHNLGRGVFVLNAFQPTQQVFNQYLNAPKLEQEICRVDKFHPNDHLCSMFWCDQGEAIPQDTCKCYRAQEIKECTGKPNMRVKSKVLTELRIAKSTYDDVNKLQEKELENLAGWIIMQKSDGVKFRARERIEDMIQVRYPNLLVDDGSSIKMQMTTDLEISLMRTDLEKSTCGFQDLCYCGPFACKKPPSNPSQSRQFHDFYEIKTPILRLYDKGRRLANDSSLFGGSDNNETGITRDDEDYHPYGEDMRPASADRYYDMDHAPVLRSGFSRTAFDEVPGHGDGADARSLQTVFAFGAASWNQAMQFVIPKNKRSTIDVVFGINIGTKAPLLGELSAEDTWQFNDDFQPWHPSSQRSMFDFCSQVPNSMRVTLNACWILVFANLMVFRGIRFPLADREDSDRMFKMFSSQQRTGVKLSKNYMWFRRGILKACFMSFLVDIDRNGDAGYAMEYKQLWDRYVREYNRHAPPMVRGAFHTAALWVRSESTLELIQGTLTTLLIIVSFSFVSMFVFTKDLRLAIFVVTSTLWVVIGLLFFIVVVMQLDVGAIEVIALIAFIGYALDYSFHIAHEYSLPVAIQPTKEAPDEEAGKEKQDRPPTPESQGSKNAYYNEDDDTWAHLPKDALTPSQQRKRRTTYSVCAIGGAALGSALTTGGSAFFLLFCQLTLFPRLGAVVMAVTFISIIASFGPLPAVLLIRGPINPGQGFVIIKRKVWYLIRPTVLWTLRMIKLWGMEDEAAKDDPQPVEPPPGSKVAGVGCCAILVGLMAASLAMGATAPVMDTQWTQIMRNDVTSTNLHETFWSMKSQRQDGVVGGLRKQGSKWFATLQLEIAFQPSNSTYHKSKLADFKEKGIDATFSQESLLVCRKVERALTSLESWKEWSKKVPSKYRKDCKPGISLINFLFPTPSASEKYIQTSRSHVPDYFLFDGKAGEDMWPDGFGANWGELPIHGMVHYMEKHGIGRIVLPRGAASGDPRLLMNNTKAFRTVFVWRIPCKDVPCDTEEEREEFKKNLKEEWITWMDTEILPLLRKPFGGLERMHDPIKVWYNATYVDEIHAMEIMRTDESFYIAAWVVMFVFLLNHNGSIFLSAAGVLLNVGIVGLSSVIVGGMTDAFNLATFPAGAALIAFLGVDAICIYTDISREPDTQGKTRVAYTMRRGGATVVPTMVFAAACSLTSLISTAPALRELGLFVCFGAVLTAVLTLLIFVPVLELDAALCAGKLGKLKFKGYCPGNKRLGLWTYFINHYRMSALAWMGISGAVFLLLGLTNLHDINAFDNLNTLSQNVFRWEDNWNEGRRLFGTFAPVSENVWDSKKAFMDLPYAREDQVESMGSGFNGAGAAKLHKKGYLPFCKFYENTWDNANCPFYWCDVIPEEFKENNVSRCDCFRFEKTPKNNETCRQNPEKKHVQRFFGWLNWMWLDEWQHKDVRVSHIDPAIPRTIIGKDTIDAEVRYDHANGPVYVDFAAYTNQSNLTIREIAPLMIQEWTTGQIEVEPGIEVETFLPRLSVNDTCERHDNCFCGDFRCNGPDFEKYESMTCGMGMTLAEDAYYGDHEQCRDHCRETQCTAFIRINGGSGKAGTCQFFVGRFISRYKLMYYKDQRDCYERIGAKIKEVDNYVEYGAYAYASLDNVQPYAWFSADRGWSLYNFGEVCQTHWNKLPVPDGWEIVPDIVDEYGVNITDFIHSQSWSTYGMVLGNGKCYETGLATDDLCWTETDMIQTDGAGRYWAKECFNRVLIRRPHKTQWIGCYMDDRSRDFRDGPRRYGWQEHSKYGEYFSNHTTGTCRLYCSEYDYFALQQGGYCQCSNDYYRYWKYKRLPDSECGAICPGEEGLSPPRYCGGTLKNAVYKTKEEDMAPGATWSARCVSCATHAPEDRQGTFLDIIKRPYEEIAMCRSQCATKLTREQQLMGSSLLYGCLNDCDMKVKSKELFTEVTLEQCKELCRVDPSCKSIDFGKGTRAETCYINRVDAGASYVNSKNYDVHVIDRKFWPKSAIGYMHHHHLYNMGPEADISKSMVHVVFGVTTSLETPMFGRIVENPWAFSEDFKLSDPDTQRQVSYFCQMVAYPHWASTAYQHCPGTYLRVTQKWCWMDDFRKWLVRAGYDFPVPANKFDELAKEFSYNNLIHSEDVNMVDFHGFRTKSAERADTFLWVRKSQVKALYVSFALDVNATDRINTKSYYYAQPQGTWELKEIWDKYLGCWNDKQGAAAKGAWHTSTLWADVEQKKMLTESTLIAIAISVAVVLLGGLLTTCHKRLWIIVASVVVWVEAGCCFLLFTVLGRSFGVVQACSLVSVAWVAAVPSMHMAHMYKQEKKPPGDPETDRYVQYQRTRSSIKAAGKAAVGTATTIGCSAACLFGSELHALQEFGAVVMTAAFMSGIAAMVLLPSVLLLCTGQEDLGPQPVSVAPLMGEQPASSSGAPLPPPGEDPSSGVSESPLPSAPNVNTIGKGSGLQI